jgi:uncharacterized repeat protein (TIGR02543 family)
MKKMYKLLAGFLSLVILLTVIPTTVFAAELPDYRYVRTDVHVPVYKDRAMTDVLGWFKRSSKIWIEEKTSSGSCKTGAIGAWGVSYAYVEASNLIEGPISNAPTGNNIIYETAYTISFSANGGSGSPSSVKTDSYGEAKIPTKEPTRSGYEFEGWAKSSSASSASYTSGDWYEFSSNTTLYAVWEANSIPIRNPSIGSVSVSPSSIYVGGSVTITVSGMSNCSQIKYYAVTSSGSEELLATKTSPGSSNSYSCTLNSTNIKKIRIRATGESGSTATYKDANVTVSDVPSNPYIGKVAVSPNDITVGGSVTITVSEMSNCTQIKYYAVTSSGLEELLATKTSPGSSNSYSCTLNSTNITKIRVRATGAAGTTATYKDASVTVSETTTNPPKQDGKVSKISLSSASVTQGDTFTVSATISGTFNHTDFYVKTSTTSGTTYKLQKQVVTGKNPSTTFDTDSLTPGRYYVYAVVYGNDGVLDNNDYKTLTVNEPPTNAPVQDGRVSTMSLNPSSVTQGNSFTVSATISGTFNHTDFYVKTSTTSGTTYKLQEQVVTGKNPSATFDTDSLTPGKYYVYAVVYGNDGVLDNNDYKTLTVNEPPTNPPVQDGRVSTMSLSPSSVTQGDSFTVSATINGTFNHTDFYVKTSTTSGTTYKLQKQVVTGKNPSATFDTNSLTPGKYYVYAVVYGNDGVLDNDDYKTLTINKKDDAPPQGGRVSTMSLSPSSVTQGDSFTVSATISGTFNHTDFYVKTSTTSGTTYKLQKQVVTGKNPSATFDTYSLVSGTYYVYAVVYGENGGLDNNDYKELTVIEKPTQPSSQNGKINSMSLSSSTIKQGESFTVNATVDGQFEHTDFYVKKSTLSGTKAELQKQVITGQNPSFTFNSTSLEAGEYYVYAVVYGQDGILDNNDYKKLTVESREEPMTEITTNSNQENESIKINLWNEVDKITYLRGEIVSVFGEISGNGYESSAFYLKRTQELGTESIDKRISGVEKPRASFSTEGLEAGHYYIFLVGTFNGSVNDLKPFVEFDVIENGNYITPQCDKDNVGYYVNAAKDGGSMSILINSNCDWSVVLENPSTENWITNVDKRRISTNIDEITFSIQKNSYGSPREMGIKIYANGCWEKIRVKQEAQAMALSAQFVDFLTSNQRPINGSYLGEIDQTSYTVTVECDSSISSITVVMNRDNEGRKTIPFETSEDNKYRISLSKDELIPGSIYYLKVITSSLNCEDNENCWISFRIKTNRQVTSARSASQNALHLISNYEGFVPYVYDDAYGRSARIFDESGNKIRDISGHATIGYGKLWNDSIPKTVSQEQAWKWFEEDITGYADAVCTAMDRDGFVLNQNQFDAMVSLAYNAGKGVFTSTTYAPNLMKLLREPPYNEADFRAYFKESFVTSNGTYMQGLADRRSTEMNLFFTPMSEDQINNNSTNTKSPPAKPWITYPQNNEYVPARSNLVIQGSNYDHANNTYYINLYDETEKQLILDRERAGSGNGFASIDVSKLKGHTLAIKIFANNGSSAESESDRIIFNVSQDSKDALPNGYDFYLQDSGDWATKEYGKDGSGLSSFAEAACGLFAVKNALRPLGYDISVEDLEKYAIDSKARTSDGGTYVKKLLAYLHDNYDSGIEWNAIGTDTSKAISHLQSGGTVIANVTSTRGGHYETIIRYDVNTNQFLVQDSSLISSAAWRGDKGQKEGTWILADTITANLKTDNYLIVY